jgi:tetratricopeptide (TPR) repeat protein
MEITSGTLDALTSLEHAFPDDASVIYDLSVSETRFGYETIMLGDPEGAAPHYQRAVDLRERALKLSPDHMVYRRSLKIAYEHMAGVMGNPLIPNLGRPDEARKYLQKERMLEEAAFDDPQRHFAQADYAHFLLMSSIIDTRPGEVAASLAGLRRAASVYEAFALLDPDLINIHGQLATIRIYMGHRLSSQLKFSEAAVEYRHGLAEAERILSKIPTDEKTFAQAMEASRGMARSLASSGDRSAAIREAATLQIRARQSPSTNAAVRATHLADAQVTLAEVHLTLGNPIAACSAAHDAIAQIQPYVPVLLRRSDRRAILLREAQSTLSACEAARSGTPK